MCFRRYGYFRAPAGAAEKTFWGRRCLATEVRVVPGITVADGRALTARYQTTDDLQMKLQAPHGRISFRVAFVILPGSDDVMIIGSKTLRESLDIDIAQAFHQRVSQVGELFAAPDSAVRADETVSSVRRLSAPFGTTAENCLFGFVPEILKNREKRWENRAIKSQVCVNVALRGIPLSTFKISFILSWIGICIDFLL